ncbi:MAG: hypothetical protein B7Y39_01990 [Bdellovibrio sp. 28-41-41]|nr:MAG: hypothetical protein B7Y39_01990 [Bdellovibrio sp. 28-41-41]
MKKIVLIIDDESELRTCICDSFEQLDFTVIQASNGFEALQLIAGGQKIDLILTDIDMPIKNGIDFLKEFRVRDRSTPVIVMTGGCKYTEAEVLKAGATVFLHKPIPKIDSIFKMLAA